LKYLIEVYFTRYSLNNNFQESIKIYANNLLFQVFQVHQQHTLRIHFHKIHFNEIPLAGANFHPAMKNLQSFQARIIF
jgi:hypothetical protein